MIFKETPNTQMPTIILLHGGGLSYWSWQGIVDQLQVEFHIVTPIIDGHGEAANEDFISIEDSAGKIIKYIDTNCQGRVQAMGGLSIGAQIVIEVLSQRTNIAEYAFIESALVYPIKGTATLTDPTYKIFYGLLKRKWFSQLQARALHVPANMFELYYRDSLKISRQSLINITLSNGSYNLKSSLANTNARVLIIVGEKEIGIMKRSAQRLHEVIKDSRLYIAPAMKHGELSLMHPEKYVELAKSFLSNS